MKKIRILIYLLFVAGAVLTGVVASDHALRVSGRDAAPEAVECPAMKQKCPAMERTCPGTSGGVDEANLV